MCGIAGIFHYRQPARPVNTDELLKIREAMHSRGPDGHGVWISDKKHVGLAHRRLSIIDLSTRGAQPMAAHDGSLRVVFNGEIYNYRELRSELQAKGYCLHSNSDTEVLLYLYHEHGPEMVQALRGMYAFAIWDEKNMGLFLARDPFGIKPLYYSDNGSAIKFASQVKALLKCKEIDTTPQPAGHVGFLLWGYVPEPFTLYKGIRALPAGSTLWIDETGSHDLNIFFNISDELARAGDLALVSHEEVQQRLGAALRDSVRYHLIADVDVGVFLSSGLDSTTLAGLAAEVGSGALRTITLGFNEYSGTENDETPLAEEVAERYGTSHQTRWISRVEFQADLDNLLHAMDQPTIDGVNTYFVSKVAAQTGLKVAMSGLGGDELFRGYPSFKDIPHSIRATRAVRYIPWLGKAFRWFSAPVLKHFTSPKYAGLLEYGDSYGGAYLLRRGLFMPWELADILDGEMAQKGWRDLQPLVCLQETIREIGLDHLKVSTLEITWYLRNQLLRDADWAGMAHSLEIRVPLVDLELMRHLAPLLALRTPPTKRDMASAPTIPLPNEVLNRPKTGFSVPVREWLLGNASSMVAGRGLRGWALKLYDNWYIS